ncbi:MAG: hypothetical protein HQK65_00595 [Desulfamplus sp.]|nr:hypothetical protein [Desulfamplus sp.]
MSANGITRFGIGKGVILNSLIIAPPIEEQKKIAEYIDNQVIKIFKAINRIEQSIVLLKEYKTSLISHVVTGKIQIY